MSSNKTIYRVQRFRPFSTYIKLLKQFKILFVLVLIFRPVSISFLFLIFCINPIFLPDHLYAEQLEGPIFPQTPRTSPSLPPKFPSMWGHRVVWVHSRIHKWLWIQPVPATRGTSNFKRDPQKGSAWSRFQTTQLRNDEDNGCSSNLQLTREE